MAAIHHDEQLPCKTKYDSCLDKTSDYDQKSDDLIFIQCVDFFLIRIYEIW